MHLGATLSLLRGGKISCGDFHPTVVFASGIISAREPLRSFGERNPKWAYWSPTPPLPSCRLTPQKLDAGPKIEFGTSGYEPEGATMPPRISKNFIP